MEIKDRIIAYALGIILLGIIVHVDKIVEVIL